MMLIFIILKLKIVIEKTKYELKNRIIKLFWLLLCALKKSVFIKVQR